VNKFLGKCFTAVSLFSSVCSVSNFCSALREFPDWCYGEGKVPEEGKTWFINEFSTRFNRLTEACISLGKDFNEKNKAETEKSFVNAFKLMFTAAGNCGDGLGDIMSSDKAGLMVNAFNKFENAFDCLSLEAREFLHELSVKYGIARGSALGY